MSTVKVSGEMIHIGEHFSVSFERTLRIPDDGQLYPLPPSLGSFPISRVDDYIDRVPESWRERRGFFIPMYQREALWMYFNGTHWRPNAVKVGIGNINAISGKPWNLELDAQEQDYLVCPDQPWLDGINAGDGFIRQFVAMPLGMGYTVEGQLTGKEEFGGIQIAVFDPKPGIFTEPPEHDRLSMLFDGMICEESSMGLGAGGKMKQEIYPDEWGIETWDQSNCTEIVIHIVNSSKYREITGMQPPASPVSAATYTKYGFPWYELYNEGKGDLGASPILEKVKSVNEMAQGNGDGLKQNDDSINIPQNQVKKIIKKW